MAEWLSRMLSKVGGSDARAAVRDALTAALRQRARVCIELPDQGIVAATQVQQISNEEIVIAVPSIGGMTYPLAFGESLKISFVQARSNLSGNSRCLGRIKVPAGDGRTLFAYRIALPDSLKVDERRGDARVDLPLEIAPEGQLYGGRLAMPIVGRVTNISVGGARLTLAAPPRCIAIGHELYLKFMMPEPVGLVDEVVEVQRIESDPRTARYEVGVSFHRRLERLLSLMRPGSAVGSAPHTQRRSA